MPVKNKKEPLGELSSELYEIGVELHSLGYLLQITGSTGDPDLEEFHWGMGRIIEKLSKRIKEIERTLGEMALEK